MFLEKKRDRKYIALHEVVTKRWCCLLTNLLFNSIGRFCVAPKCHVQLLLLFMSSLSLLGHWVWADQLSSFCTCALLICDHQKWKFHSFSWHRSIIVYGNIEKYWASGCRRRHWIPRKVILGRTSERRSSSSHNCRMCACFFFLREDNLVSMYEFIHWYTTIYHWLFNNTPQSQESMPNKIGYRE